VIKMWLERAAISTKGIAIHDGSGLSRLDLVSPEVTTGLLVAIAATNSFQIFHDSLPISGRDGTLSERLRAVAGRVAAKTGTLTYDHSLSGYLTTDTNETFAFSIFCNDATDRDPVKVIDQIVTLIASPKRNQD
jgi:serine-type D-Ala-D-Ala carboxypeptidase/endopeptidase (penicillin-binding protein 4)